METSNEMVEVNGMAMVRAPEAVLAEAHKAAVALQTIIKGKVKPVVFNSEQYIEFEDWQVLARFYGLAAKVMSTTPVDFGGVRGFEARAVVVDMRSGVEVSAAEAMCLNDEEKWSSRTKYEWDKEAGKRVPTGEVPVPMFQLRSMAQTRACAKALRNVLAWVVVLAGYKPTVAEEMTGDEESGETKPPIQQPARASAAPPAGNLKSKSFVPTLVKDRVGKGPFKIESQDGMTFNTFSDDFAEMAREAIAMKAEVTIGYEQTKFGLDIKTMTPPNDAAETVPQ